ncbi:MAG: hypothetical protein JWO80_1247 [Bryobacterales bacterium]|nr:hypothetical protein [Bryobacterales bacterium]
MTKFEVMYLCLEPFLPPLHRKARAALCRIARSVKIRPEVLDVGGRMSNYTIGVPANVTVTDVPRASATQHNLHLGTNNELIERLARRRSNVTGILYDDMTKSELPSSTFDCVAAIEVLEHVEEDDTFLREVRRVLKPGKPLVMSTPNGEFVKNTNADHKRHYTREQLTRLLEQHFETVRVEYAVRNGQAFGLALRSWSLRHPLKTAITMASGFISTFQSKASEVRWQSWGTHQLFAVAVKGEAEQK